MWANVNPPGGYNRAHIHPNCHGSGVYYIKLQKILEEIVFNDPRTGADMVITKMKKRKSPHKFMERSSC